MSLDNDRPRFRDPDHDSFSAHDGPPPEENGSSPASGEVASYTACQWEYTDFEPAWETSCGEMFQFISGGPEENGFEYCPYCGDEIEAVHAV